jgi:glycosyltransferase involved in cell wall biosynthesis
MARVESVEALKNAPGRKGLSVIVTTYNEEINVAECLESVLWADEILLVDSFSSDRTVAIAEKFPITILQRQYFGSAAQKNWAIDRVKHEWVLIIDADERVPDKLAREILTVLASEPSANGFYIRRLNVFIDKVIRHSGWSTDKVVRLFKKDKGRYPNRRVHADLEIEGPVPVLKNPFLHYTFRTFEQYFPKFLNYAEWGAAQAFRDGRRAGLVELFIRPWWRFIRTYFIQLGFLDGKHGFVLCVLQAFGSFLKYGRLWEYGIRSRRGEKIDLPAFDDDQRTWARPEDEGASAGAAGVLSPPEGAADSERANSR